MIIELEKAVNLFSDRRGNPIRFRSLGVFTKGGRENVGRAGLHESHDN
jgi:hypothetical protein